MEVTQVTIVVRSRDGGTHKLRVDGEGNVVQGDARLVLEAAGQVVEKIEVPPPEDDGDEDDEEERETTPVPAASSAAPTRPVASGDGVGDGAPEGGSA